ARVVAVLLAAFAVAAGGLQVAVRERADPHVAPRRRNGERADARELLLVLDLLAVHADVAKAAAVTQATDSGARVEDVLQPGVGRRLHRGRQRHDVRRHRTASSGPWPAERTSHLQAHGRCGRARAMPIVFEAETSTDPVVST